MNSSRTAALAILVAAVGGCRTQEQGSPGPAGTADESGLAPAAANEHALRDTEPSAEGAVNAAAAQNLEPDAAEIDRLRAMGYMAYAETPADPGRVGVVRHERAKTAPGYNLYVTRHLCTATLMDMDGKSFATWSYEPCRGWDHAELLPGGDLLVSGGTGGRPGLFVDSRPRRYLLRLGPGGEAVWKLPIDAHHDAVVTPAGQIAALTSDFRRIPAVDRRLKVRDDQITILGLEGRVKDKLGLFDAVRQNAVGFQLQQVKAAVRRRDPTVDLFHANAIKWMDRPALAARDSLYEGTNAIVTIRHQDTIAVIDLAERQLIWAWGQGELDGPHDATLLDNGNFLIFDNGLVRGWSRVIELDPLNYDIVWQHRGPAGHDFYTASHGAAQRLANGNTLITVSDEARAFEVTRSGEVVWEFWNPPAPGDPARRPTINRMRRYSAAAIAPVLAARRVAESAKAPHVDGLPQEAPFEDRPH